MSEDWVEFEGHCIDVIPLTGERPAEEAKIFRIAVLRNGRSLARFRNHAEAVQVAQALAHLSDLGEFIAELASDCEEIPDELSKVELLARIKALATLMENPIGPSNPEDNIPF